MDTSIFSNIELTIWLTRPDLQEKFSSNQNAFLCWLLVNGVNEYKGLREQYQSQDDSFLFSESTLNLITSEKPARLTKLLEVIWYDRPDLQQAFDINTEAGQMGLVQWFYFHGVGDWDLWDLLPKSFVTWVIKPADANMIPNLALLLWQNEIHLQAAFPQHDSEGFKEWLLTHGQTVIGLLRKYKTASETEANNFKSQNKLNGVNLIGYAKGQLGIGEDVRMAALALESANIPYAIYNIEPGSDVDQNDNSLESKIGKELPFNTNIFCVTGMECARLQALFGKVLFEDFYNIGYWPWELENWPKAWRHAYELVDEVWASSYFAYQAYIKTATCKVRHMPMAVDTSPTNKLTRTDFKLPEDKFLFTFSFDFLSSLARKNPVACVKAFLAAFPKHSYKDVGLVIKCMRFDKDLASWKELSKLIKGDDRFILMNKTLSRAEVLDLYRVTDCFISLHRSEGFGRGIADAMAVKKPVICTGYSGNMDFTTPANALLVDYTFTKADDYPFGEGEKWAEPDTAHAAEQMKLIYENESGLETLSKLAKKQIKNAYAPEIVGSRYKNVLKAYLTKV